MNCSKVTNRAYLIGQPIHNCPKKLVILTGKNSETVRLWLRSPYGKRFFVDKLTDAEGKAEINLEGETPDLAKQLINPFAGVYVISVENSSFVRNDMTYDEAAFLVERFSGATELPDPVIDLS